MAYVEPTHWVKNLGAAKTGRLLAVPLANSAPNLRIAADIITVDAAQNDTIGLFLISTSARLSLALSKVIWPAFGAGVVMDVGFADDAELGIATKGAVLASNVDVAAAGSGSMVPALAAADIDKDVWEILGLSADPRGYALVLATLQSANPASGTLAFEQGYYAA